MEKKRIDLEKLIQFYSLIKKYQENSQLYLKKRKYDEKKELYLKKIKYEESIYEDKKIQSNKSLEELLEMFQRKMKDEYEYSYFHNSKDACFNFRKLIKDILKTASFKFEGKIVSISCSYRTVSESFVQIEIKCDPIIPNDIYELISKSIKAIGIAFFEQKCKNKIKINVLY